MSWQQNGSVNIKDRGHSEFLLFTWTLSMADYCGPLKSVMDPSRQYMTEEHLAHELHIHRAGKTTEIHFSILFSIDSSIHPVDKLYQDRKKCNFWIFFLVEIRLSLIWWAERLTFAGVHMECINNECSALKTLLFESEGVKLSNFRIEIVGKNGDFSFDVITHICFWCFKRKHCSQLTSLLIYTFFPYMFCSSDVFLML